MDYVIVNPNKKVYIRLDANGKPETCVKLQAQRFENSKARNILDNLSKSMKRLHFKVECVPDEIVHKKEIVHSSEPVSAGNSKIIRSQEYEIPSSVSEWMNRVSSCNELAKDATRRKEELLKSITSADRKLSNKIHSIELEKHKNACAGYKEYDELKSILEKRRVIKDELLIVSLILSCNLESMATEKIRKAADGLASRVFSMRNTEDFDKLFR